MSSSGPKLRFCPESNDLLYPKEDKERKKLVYVCRRCGGELLKDGRAPLRSGNTRCMCPCDASSANIARPRALLRAVLCSLALPDARRSCRPSPPALSLAANTGRMLILLTGVYTATRCNTAPGKRQWCCRCGAALGCRGAGCGAGLGCAGSMGSP